VEELKRLGVEDSFVMQDTTRGATPCPWRFFHQRRLTNTSSRSAKKVSNRQSRARNLDGGHASLIIKAGGANIEAELVKLKQNFPATELKAVPCSQ